MVTYTESGREVSECRDISSSAGAVVPTGHVDAVRADVAMTEAGLALVQVQRAVQSGVARPADTQTVLAAGTSVLTGCRTPPYSDQHSIYSVSLGKLS